VRRHAVWLLVAFCYVYPLPYFQRLNNPNENVRIWETRALAEYHQIDITRVSLDWGFVDDKSTVGDQIFSGKAPGTSLLGVPVFDLQRTFCWVRGASGPSVFEVTWALRLFTVALPIVVFLFFFGQAVEHVTDSTTLRDLLVLGLGLGTPLYAYGLLFVGHAQAAALAFNRAAATLETDEKKADTNPGSPVPGAAPGAPQPVPQEQAARARQLANYSLNMHNGEAALKATRYDDAVRCYSEALRCHAVPPDDSSVVAIASGNTVMVSGRVRTQEQRDAVVGAAWRGHAVMAVIDDALQITG